MPAIMTNAMTNGVPITYYNNFAGLFADSRGGWAFTSGQLTVLSPVVTGVYAYSSQSTFVNTFAVNGVTSTDTMTVVATYNTGRAYAAYADSLVQPSSCSSANVAVLSTSPVVTGCSVMLAPNSGASGVVITATYSGFSSAVAYRAFYFVSYTLSSTRTQLRRLGCEFETAHLVAYGAVTVDGSTMLATVDLSNIATFTSSNPSVVSVTGRVARGVALGSTGVSFGGGLASVTLTTSSSAATVVHLISYAYSSVVVTPLSIPSATELSTAVVQLKPMLSLTAEQQTALVVTYAQDDDGVWTDVSQYPTLTLSSNASADLTLSKSGSDWLVTVPAGASSISGVSPVGCRLRLRKHQS